MFLLRQLPDYTKNTKIMELWKTGHALDTKIDRKNQKEDYQDPLEGALHNSDRNSKGFLVQRHSNQANSEKAWYPLPKTIPRTDFVASAQAKPPFMVTRQPKLDPRRLETCFVLGWMPVFAKFRRQKAENLQKKRFSSHPVQHPGGWQMAVKEFNGLGWNFVLWCVPAHTCDWKFNRGTLCQRYFTRRSLADVKREPQLMGISAR